MKITILFSLICLTVQAFAYPCPQDLEINPTSQTIHAWLNQFQGQRELKNCQIEITACDPRQPRGNDVLIGEIYIVDASKREAYLPITLVNSDRIETAAGIYRKRISYIKYDRYFEEEFGRTEAHRLEMRTDSSGENLRSLTLGTYATRKRLRSPDGNQSRWYVCE